MTHNKYINQEYNKHTNNNCTNDTNNTTNINTTNCVHKQTAPTGGMWGKWRVIQISKRVKELLVGAGRAPHIPPGWIPVTVVTAGRGAHLQPEDGVVWTGGGGGGEGRSWGKRKEGEGEAVGGEGGG